MTATDSSPRLGGMLSKRLLGELLGAVTDPVCNLLTGQKNGCAGTFGSTSPSPIPTPQTQPPASTPDPQPAPTPTPQQPTTPQQSATPNPPAPQPPANNGGGSNSGGGSSSGGSSNSYSPNSGSSGSRPSNSDSGSSNSSSGSSSGSNSGSKPSTSSGSGSSTPAPSPSSSNSGKPGINSGSSSSGGDSSSGGNSSSGFNIGNSSNNSSNSGNTNAGNSSGNEGNTSGQSDQNQGVSSGRSKSNSSSGSNSGSESKSQNQQESAGNTSSFGSSRGPNGGGSSSSGSGSGSNQSKWSTQSEDDTKAVAQTWGGSSPENSGSGGSTGYDKNGEFTWVWDDADEWEDRVNGGRGSNGGTVGEFPGNRGTGNSGGPRTSALPDSSNGNNMAGVIGGCITVFVVLILIIFFILYRFRDHPSMQRMRHRLSTLNPFNLWPYSRFDRHQSWRSSMGGSLLFTDGSHGDAILEKSAYAAPAERTTNAILNEKRGSLTPTCGTILPPPVTQSNRGMSRLSRRFSRPRPISVASDPFADHLSPELPQVTAVSPLSANFPTVMVTATESGMKVPTPPPSARRPPPPPPQDQQQQQQYYPYDYQCLDNRRRRSRPNSQDSNVSSLSETSLASSGVFSPSMLSYVSEKFPQPPSTSGTWGPGSGADSMGSMSPPRTPTKFGSLSLSPPVPALGYPNTTTQLRVPPPRPAPPPAELVRMINRD